MSGGGKVPSKNLLKIERLFTITVEIRVRRTHITLEATVRVNAYGSTRLANRLHGAPAGAAGRGRVLRKHRRRANRHQHEELQDVMPNL